MPAERGPRNSEVRIENILPMLPGGQPVVDNEREDDGARGRFAVGNVFAPGAAACAIAADPRPGIAAIASRMPESSGGLVSAMVRGRPGHSRRKDQRRLRWNASQKANRLVQGPRAFLRPDSRVSRQNHNVAVHPAAQFLDEGRVKGWILPGEIQLANHGARGRTAASDSSFFPSQSWMNKKGDEK